ncbi:MAG: hypothetical protein NDI69_04535 [Bacteriovoracaceae bacterium]|nr:hypothetical protein [Bacteriovoracaceae bacterium]
MKFVYRVIVLILISTQSWAHSEILPDIFKTDTQSRPEFCSSPEASSSSFWFNLMASHIEELLRQSELAGVEKDVLTNQLVTLSYLELSQNSQNHIRAMGYVYANASHHLGRLVRFHYWQRYKGLPLALADQALIQGTILGTTVRTFPLMLSKRLMAHSLDLYKTLSWSLGASAICGPEYVRDLLKRISPRELVLVFPGLEKSKQEEVLKQLKAAFQTEQLEHFIKHFVAFEQTYLQYTMYAVPEVKVPTALGVLDKMRFIPFNGEKSTSFHSWCQSNKCNKTSLHLGQRILFDQTVIQQEIARTQNDPIILQERMRRSQLQEVANFVLNDLFPGGVDDNSVMTVIHR